MAVVYSCGDISHKPKSNEYHKAMAARKSKDCFAIIASSQVINHTSKGDFTHLAAVGHCTSVIQ